MTAGRERYAHVRSLLEVPILVERYWDKVPTVQADAIMIDLEDSAAPADKERARARVVEALGDRSHFGAREVVVRVNNLETPWARGDLVALAHADGDFLVSYPKARSADEVVAVAGILREHRDARPLGLHVMIETAGAVQELDAISAVETVQGLHFGYVDFAADVGSRPFDDAGDDLYLPGSQVRSTVAIAAAAHGLFATGGSLVPNYQDLDVVRRFVRTWRDVGYTACIALAPRHLPIVNEIMTPSPAEVEYARVICRRYEEALLRGEAAVLLDGRVVTRPDYRVAGLVLARAGEPVGHP
ncbi:conserved hypothetical protein [Frankia canadensis]|uniref:HpcH/HpaI aldolase/citrate lyase domain-containing protein n=1 Tax=Frankia canadensis TaxID=1836972 RepID=A0A2I2KIA5_9ACTN|nr:CoA ester lyase [Frankia canadensis]SNQ45400.1 conserved hypothetical protein [Frankia canadensis]SOU52690.1 conserved hypothetical protein [Frankia canadensis]